MQSKPIPHPAKYSKELLPVLAKYCYGDCIDIMGGTGKAGLLKQLNTDIKSVTINELEPEWANQASQYNVDKIIIGDARQVIGHYDCIVTSPPYGNRMADNFKASKPSSMRKIYAGDLGRTPSNGSVCCIHYNDHYRAMMYDILKCAINNIKPKRIIWNTSNFIRQFKEVDIFTFYIDVFKTLGYNLIQHERVATRRQRGVGANTHLRVPYEDIAVYERQLSCNQS